MHDERVVERSLLCIEDAAHRLRIECIGPESVNSFGGECDQLAAHQACRGLGEYLGRGVNGVDTPNDG